MAVCNGVYCLVSFGSQTEHFPIRSSVSRLTFPFVVIIFR